MKLDYKFSYETYGEYCTKIKRKSLRYDEFIHKLIYYTNLLLITGPNVCIPKQTFTISTRLPSKNIFSSPLFVLGLDCDSKLNLELATNELDERKMNYCIVNSSANDRYWVLVDYIGSKKDIVYMIQEIPGVDPKYINHINCAFPVFRAFPKDIIPIFGSIKYNNTNKDSYVFHNWISSFQKYWESDVIKNIYKRRVMSKLITI